MPKHAVSHFNAELNKLFLDRTYWLRNGVGGATSKRPPKINRKKINRAISRLQDLASDAIAHDQAKSEFAKLVIRKKQWQVKGYGRDGKRAKFDRWFDRHLNARNFVYIFWKGPKCLYVGKTEGGNGRPQQHFEKWWFGWATRVDIHVVSARTQVLKLECLAKHRFLPTYNKIDPPTRTWYKKCPVCSLHALIHDEMRRIFALKK